MPIPLADLDTRRWDDLVEEGRGLIPRYSPSWTDHNIHDPGITLIELFSWLIEQDIYRVNRIPARHERKFLQLTGLTPQPPSPARVPLTFTLNGTTPQHLPVGATITTTSTVTQEPVPFRTIAPLNVVPAAIVSIHAFDGWTTTNQSRALQNQRPFAMFGDDPTSATDPDHQPTFYIGLDAPLPINTPVSFWIQVTPGAVDWSKHQAIIDEFREQAESCISVRPDSTCPPETPESEEPTATDPQWHLPPHHSARLVWEFFDGTSWQRLDKGAGQVLDETRSLSLDSSVTVALPSLMAETRVGNDSAPHYYLRSRLVAGQFDAAPIAQSLAINTVAAEQAAPVFSTFPIASGAVLPPANTFAVGDRVRFLIWFNGDDEIEHLATTDDQSVPETIVMSYEPPHGQHLGALVTTSIYLGHGNGQPDQHFTLPDAPITRGDVSIWTQIGSSTRSWVQYPDFDAADGDLTAFTLDSTTGQVHFGNGNRGRVVPDGAAIFAAYDVTAASDGNVTTNSTWTLAGEYDLLNSAILGDDPGSVDANIASISNQVAASGGANQETVRHAIGRATESLWAHERLQELCPADTCATLDNLPLPTIKSRPAPARAATLLDYERLAHAVPGVQIRRARAFADIDPTCPGLRASGTVTLVILPGLPRARPRPEPTLLRAVRRFLERRRTIGTRLLVVGPEYIEVQIRAQVRAKTASDAQRIPAEVIEALNAFLDPLTGGPQRLGWPFGRDVYRSEILQVIDGAEGVDHVLSLEMTSVPGQAVCDNICVPPTWLVTPGEHQIEVLR